MKFLRKNLFMIQPDLDPDTVTVAHYFFTFSGTKLERTHENMLRSILHRILDQDELTFPNFQREFRHFGRSNPEWPYDSLKRILSSFANHPPTKPLFLILDALDESEENDQRCIIEMLYELCINENLWDVKAVIASRPVAGLTEKIKERCPFITMQEQNKRDISAFSDAFLKNDLQLTGDALHEATHYIDKHAHGVFVWVSLVKSELKDYHKTSCSEKELLECLKSLPTELEAFYRLMFNRLENGKSRDVRDGQRLFRFVLLALRPLTTTELRHALAVQEDPDPEDDFEKNLTSDIASRIVHCGANFLEIKGKFLGESNCTITLTAFAVDNTVQIMHKTAREFLIMAIPAANAMKIELSDEQAQASVVETWLRYLTICFSGPTIQDHFSKAKTWRQAEARTYIKALNEWHLLEYTLRYIKDHHDRCEQNERISHLTTNLVKLLTKTPASYFLGRWVAIRLGRTNSALRQIILILLGVIRKRAVPQRRSMLALACPKYSANAENIHYITFDTAAEQKLSPIRETLLLTCMEDVNHPDNRNSLMIAAQNGLEDGTRLLLDQNVDTNAKDKSGSTALHHATKSGNEAIVKLLLSRGSDRNVKDKSGWTPLQYAMKSGDKNIIKLLLDQQVQKNAKNQSGRTALHHTMKKGYEDTVRPLLGGGVDQKVKDKSGRTALRHATNRGRIT